MLNEQIKAIKDAFAANCENMTSNEIQIVIDGETFELDITQTEVVSQLESCFDAISQLAE